MITLPELQGLFQLSGEPIGLDLFVASCQVLDAYAITDYVQALELVVNQDPDVTAGELCARLVGTSKALMVEVLNAQGVVVDEEAMHSELNELALATLEFPHHEDKQLLATILGYDESAEELYAQLCALSCSLSVERILTIVQAITVPDFAQNLLEAIAQPQEEDEPVIDPRVLRAWTQFLQAHPEAQASMAKGYALYPQAMGLPFSFYFDQYLSAVGNVDVEFTEESALIHAQQLLGLACLSEDGCMQPQLTIRAQLSRLSSELKHVSRIDSQLTQLIQGSRRAGH